MLSKLRWGTTLALVAILPGSVAAASKISFEYSTEPGYFTQEDPSINGNPPDYTKIEYGLIDRPYATDSTFDPTGQKPKWERFANFVTSLNHRAGTGAVYKLLYLARHGEAYHNVAQSYYGARCWDCYWSQQDGNGSATWRDAEMTPNGIRQVLASNAFWRDTAPALKIPFPESFYVSPMARTLATANLTFASLPLWSESRPFAPTVKERLREAINACTCAWRHPKSWISERFPTYVFEPGFAEDDEVFSGKSVESPSAQTARIRLFLDELFSTDNNTFISVTTHGVNINPLLGIIGHPNPKFSVPTGQAIPVLVKAERVPDAGSEPLVDPPTPAESCDPCGPGM
ncbi:putative phosphoglycerate mutase pmu1 [Madurella fahalii]|uniref:Phosphoglycerate mutase pmu1 n=1 Tax=Madurella fahalii TaxID=1157608 RepID=A0ABQ0GJ53_9PEZI